MYHGEVIPALPVFRVSPPYEELRRFVVPPPGRAVSLTPGTVLVMSVRDRTSDWPCLQRQVPSVRRAFPESPAVVLVPRSSDTRFTHLAGRVSGLHVRAVLVEGEPLAFTLRRELTDVPDLAAEVEEWLCLVELPMSPATQRCIGSVFRLSPSCTRASDLACRIRTPVRTVRSWFHSDGLPPPSRWIGAARALHACLRLQRYRDEALLETSRDAGYCDLSALSRQVTRLFGLRLSTVRDSLGWEWMLGRWLAREGCSLRPCRPQGSRRAAPTDGTEVHSAASSVSGSSARS